MPRFKSIIFYQNSPKIKLFLKKNAKVSSAGAPPPDPQTSPPIANLWLRAWQLFTVHNYMLFCSFCFGQFFLDRSVATYDVNYRIDVCLMLNCFLFKVLFTSRTV